MWWDETIAAWREQGLPAHLESVFDIAEHFGLGNTKSGQAHLVTCEAGIRVLVSRGTDRNTTTGARGKEGRKLAEEDVVSGASLRLVSGVHRIEIRK